MSPFTGEAAPSLQPTMESAIVVGSDHCEKSASGMASRLVLVSIVVGKMHTTRFDEFLQTESSKSRARWWVAALLMPYPAANPVRPSKAPLAPVSTSRPVSPKSNEAR